ncbi:MAG: TonB-dependent receptor [Pseudomonadota bacterium]
MKIEYRSILPSLLGGLFTCTMMLGICASPGAFADEVEYEEEVIVVGMFDEPDRVTGSAHRVGEEILEAFRHDDISRVLNFVPGLYVREEDGFGLRPNIGLRGGSSDRSQKVALMEDGVLFSPAPYSAPAAYFFPLTSRMVAVEVFKGPASIEYGPQTIGGAINMVSAPIPEDTEFEVGLGGGSDGYRQASVRGGTQIGELGLLGEFVHIGSDGFKSLDGGGDTGFEKNEALIKAEREIGPGLLQVRVGYADEVSDETYLGLTEADARRDPLRRYAASALDRMEWDWAGARATWTQELWGATLQATGYVQEFDRAWRKFNNFNGGDIRGILQNPDSPFNQVFINILQGGDTDGISGSLDDIRVGTNDRSFISQGVQGSLSWNFGDRVTHALRVGARYHYDRIRRLHDEFGFEQIDGNLVLNNQGRAITADNTGLTHAVAIWARDEISFDRWTIVPGLRIEQISNEFRNRLARSEEDNDYTVVLPGIGVNFEVVDGVTLLAGIHEGFSPAVLSLAGDLEPEESLNYELGVRWRGQHGLLEVIGYYNDYSNLTAICTFSAGCGAASLDTQINAGEVVAEGVEVGWSQDFQVSDSVSMPVRLSYTYTDAEFQEPFTSSNPQFGQVLAGYELPYVPPHRANASVGLISERWGVQLSVTYVDRMRDAAGIGSFTDSEGSDASTVIDLAAHYNVGRNWTIAARVDNAADEVDVVSRRPFGARPTKPLTFRLEARYRFAAQ